MDPGTLFPGLLHQIISGLLVNKDEVVGVGNVSLPTVSQKGKFWSPCKLISEGFYVK